MKETARRDRVVYLDNIPLPHHDPWIDLTRRYVTEAVQALGEGGLKVRRSWLDPRDPRDATIVYTVSDDATHQAVVWDEVTGWRQGRFESGRQGNRTELSDMTYLGGGVLLSSTDLVARLLAGASEQWRVYRSVSDLHDGLDDTLSRGQS
jgi:hypothetical protein